MQARTAVAAGLLGIGVLDATPSVAAIRPLRTHWLPGLTGLGNAGHVALTFDDGPHPDVTPRFLDVLAGLEVRASFFVLAEQLDRWPDLGRRVIDEGHDLALHGCRHRTHLLRPAPAVAADIARARRNVATLTGTAPVFWRPPHGIPTATGLITAARLGMRPVLWTAEAREWSRRATPQSALRLLRARVTGGGVVLLHDSDVAMRRGAWHITLSLLPELVAWCRDRGWQVGPLREHGLAALPGKRRFESPSSPARDLEEVGDRLCA